MIFVQHISKGSLFFNLTLSEREFSVPRILGDSYCITILKTVKEIPKSVVEIHYDTRIPISTLYRRIQILHDMNLLRISGSITDDGKKSFLYKSKIKSIEIKFDDELDVKIKYV
jgi:predicted transcriptional regulator